MTLEDQSSSYSQDPRPSRWTTKPEIYIAKARRSLNLFMKEDRQPRNNFRCSSSQVTKQYGTYTASPANKTTSTVIEVKSDKRLQFEVNWSSIARETSIKVRPKKSSQHLRFCIPSVTLTLL